MCETNVVCERVVDERVVCDNVCVCGVKELCESGVCERVVSEGGV